MYYNFYIVSKKSLVAIVLIILISGCKTPQVSEQILKAVDSITFKYVPDSREGICDVNLTSMKDKKLVIRGETNFPDAKDAILNYLTESGIEYLDSLQVIPDTDEIDKPWGLVSVSVCNIRKEPSHSSELVSQAIMGNPVKILKERGSWLLVQTPDHYIGWAGSSGIKELSDKELAVWKESDRLIYIARAGDILSEKDGGGVVSDIVSGAILKLVASQRDYYIVEMPDGRRGRINSSESQVFSKWCSEIKPEADKLIRFAKSLTGSPYLWGGTSSKMADCSGFVKTVYFTGGVVLARDASQQFQYGTEIDISSSINVLKPGDLLFFGHINNQGKKIITHTGMYIGDTEVIHDSGMIKVNSLDPTRSNYSSSLMESLMGARRIIGTQSGKGIELVEGHSWYN